MLTLLLQNVAPFDRNILLMVYEDTSRAHDAKNKDIYVQLRVTDAVCCFTRLTHSISGKLWSSIAGFVCGKCGTTHRQTCGNVLVASSTKCFYHFVKPFNHSSFASHRHQCLNVACVRGISNVRHLRAAHIVSDTNKQTVRARIIYNITYFWDLRNPIC